MDTGASSPLDSLTYEIPDGLTNAVGIGSCVLVPIGSRQAIGYVIGLEQTTDVEKTRPIIADIDSPIHLSSDMLDLAGWISEQYICSLPRVVSAMLPGGMQHKAQARVVLTASSCTHPHLTPSEIRLMQQIEASDDQPTVESLCSEDNKSSVQRLLRQLESKGAIRRQWSIVAPAGKPRVMRGVRVSGEWRVESGESSVSLTNKQSDLLELIKSLNRDISTVELTQRYGASSAVIAALEKKGCLERIEMAFRRTPAFSKIEQVRVHLSKEQQLAVDEIIRAIDSGAYNPFLLFGVTASGKTEVYLRCIEHALALGRTSLILLPEIALTTQVMNIFKSRFGDQVAVLHSALSAGERFDEWARIESGEARVVLGARSAVFAPISDIGLVIVDEEHEPSYKQDNPPRYNGRDVAIRRATQAGAALVLGSATPSIESFTLARNGQYKLLVMSNRIENRPMPTVHIADLREEYSKGRLTIFSSRLEGAINDCLSRGEQVMLFQNRRAYSTFLLCRDCGHVERCPNCAVSLKFHAAAKKLSCHHCDYEMPAPDKCPKCGSIRIGKFGIGTERVEEEVKKTFQGARVIRMDRDTTARKGAHGSILATFRAGEADILVGTQMIAKGLDFPNVTLVGVISADTSLNLPDFRASERTYQLVSQVAGRSGRGKRPGEVVIQTFDPEQYAIKCAVNHDYTAFYEIELEERRELDYPPFGSLVNIISRDKNDNEAKARLTRLFAAIKSGRMANRMGVTIMEPQPAVLSKLRGEYRWHMLLRSVDRQKMLDLLNGVFDSNPALRRQIGVDVDPISML
ncbi:primosomal protein N' [bacterium]|nr:primosomal protein N' [bacterium]